MKFKKNNWNNNKKSTRKNKCNKKIKNRILLI